MFFFAVNFGSKLKNKHEFFFCLFMAKQPFFAGVVPDIAAAPKIILNYEKRTYFWHPVFLRKKMSKESPPSIMLTRNPN